MHHVLEQEGRVISKRSFTYPNVNVTNNPYPTFEATQ